MSNSELPFRAGINAVQITLAAGSTGIILNIRLLSDKAQRNIDTLCHRCYSSNTLGNPAY
jgi:hypothetical protein